MKKKKTKEAPFTLKKEPTKSDGEARKASKIRGYGSRSPTGALVPTGLKRNTIGSPVKMMREP